ncbi:MAG: type II toxin-antitoxin system RelE/ParE family toxin [Chitinophagales bacterium]|nr:type II toxin-antitoxin system RelE/ParE family toxin [Bacteroidota bacterium]
MQVLFSKKAQNTIQSLYVFLTDEIKMPITALRYSKKMESFGKSLANNPYAYKICTQEKWNKRNYRCATFNKTWTFVYEVKNEKIIIRDLVLGKLIKK